MVQPRPAFLEMFRTRGIFRMGLGGRGSLIALDARGLVSRSGCWISVVRRRNGRTVCPEYRRALWLRIFGSLGKIETWTTHQGHDCTSLTARYFRRRDVTGRRKLEIEDGPPLLGCFRWSLSVETPLLLVLHPPLFTMHPCADRHEGRSIFRVVLAGRSTL